MTTILEPDVAQLGIMNAMLHGSTATTSMDELKAHLDSSPHEFAVVLGPSVAVDEAMDFAQNARITRPDLGVILLRHGVDSETLIGGPAQRHARGRRGPRPGRPHHGGAPGPQRRQGDLPDPGGRGQGRRRGGDGRRPRPPRPRAQAAADAPQGKVITVFSTKGGVGKSLVATNLGVALSDAGHRVCLVDLDVNSGDVAIMLQLNPTRTINDLVAFGGQIDAEALSTILTTASDRLSLMAAPVRLDSPDHAAATDVGLMIETLKGDVRLHRRRHLRRLRRPRAHRPGPHRRHRPGRAPSTSRRSRPSSWRPGPSTCSTSAGTAGSSSSTGPTARSA